MNLKQFILTVDKPMEVVEPHFITTQNKNHIFYKIKNVTNKTFPIILSTGDKKFLVDLHETDFGGNYISIDPFEALEEVIL